MSSVITLDFEKWKAQQVAAGHSVVLDEFVFAHVPDLDPSKDIDRSEKLPAQNQIVHRQAVNKTGLASENAVAYSVTLGTEVGNFDFNWIGLLNKASGVIGMITHAPTQKKIKTANGLQGNVLTRSFLLEFAGAAKETAITTTAETWQIDFTARLSGMDDMQRLINTDSYGEAAFFDEGFKVIRNGEQYTVKKGLAYVGGLRGVLEFDQTLNAMRNTRVYADFSYQGNLVSQWKTTVKITATNNLKNYIDAAGYPHYVFVIAYVDSDGKVIDLREKGSLSDREIAKMKKDVGKITRDYATQQALKNGLDGKQPKGDYAIRQEMQKGLSEKQPKGNYATQKELDLVRENAETRLSKRHNGADIYDKAAFVHNLGLTPMVERAENALPRESGWTFTSGAHIIQGSHNYATLTLAKADGHKALIQTQPHYSNDMLVFSYEDQSVYVPKKNGTLATLNDITSQISEIPKNTTNNLAARDGWWQCGDTGLIYQYGYYAGQYQGNTVKFPMRFAKGCHIVVITSVSGSVENWDRTARVRDFPTRESFQYWAGSAQFNIFWWAVGY
ncbi:phage tail protein [Xenorhabdus szentirmaii]|uniref:phage tail-collar fiber domain-containing protein n=1 Tax=Xenorhabdus szentirmaii TaxID=290112 RepID=UPI000C050B41|nr:phage tail protein [Xenorhabdus szentirmaii]PHM43762.1 NgrE [Xenorhabdus szentirmaii]